MTYIEITVTIAEDSRDALMNRMHEMGAVGFIENPDGLTGYFLPARSASEICNDILSFGMELARYGLSSSMTLSHKSLPEQDWNEQWKKSFVPIDAGENMTIIPSWLQASTSRIPVIIDPGMVFGTGHHETTRTCLGLIEKLGRTGRNETFLDVGTGTGILAIGASRLGFRRVVAVDVDPMAVDAARRNVIANELDNIEVREGDITAAEGEFDFIAANLLSGILVDIAGHLSHRLEHGGTALLSGMLIGQEDEVIEAMQSKDLILNEKIEDGKWITLVMIKQ